jgi:predicted metalloprotease with PDZ domain
MNMTPVPVLKVDLVFKGTDSGITYVRLPDKWANQDSLYKAVTGFTLRNTHFSIEATDDAAVKRIRHQPGAPLHIVYTLQQDWKGILNYPLNYRAIINKEYLHAIGFALLVVPKQTDSNAINVQFDWSKMPKGWNIANSFHAKNKKWQGVVLYKDLLNSLFVAGDYRLYQSNIQNKPVYLAIRGKQWKFSDTALTNAIERVFTAQRKFWNDHTEPHYLVGFTPFEGEGHINGSSLHQAFLTGLATDYPLDNHLYWLLSHEYFHRWNGIAIQMKGDEQENAWLAEGFTEYYTYKILFKAGIMSLKDYVDKTNSTIAAYYLSPVRNHEQTILGKNFWHNRDYQQLPYKKGFTYALLLDHFIGTKTGGRYSLDDLMFGLLHHIRSGKDLTDAAFLDLIRQLTGEDVSEQHYAYIKEGKTVPVASGSLGKEVADSILDISPFELGFDWDATVKNKILSGVTENSAAWQAGLRDGQKWHGASVYFDNTSEPAMIKIEAEGKITEIRYKPLAAKKERVRQFFIKQP